MSRMGYAIKTVESAAHLLASCADATVTDTIMKRAETMLNIMWSVEYRTLKKNTPPEHLATAIGAFWDEIHRGLVTTGKIYNFDAIYGELVNPPGQAGNVHVNFQCANSVTWFIMKLSIPKNEQTMPDS